MNTVAEIAPRLAVYEMSRHAGRDIRDSVTFSRDSTVDFDKRGMLTPWTNFLYWFSNVTMQAAANPIRFGMKRPFKAAGMIAGMIVLAYLRELLSQALRGDDEDDQYGNVKEWRRDMYIHYPMLGTKSKWLRLRVHGLNAFVDSIGRNIANVHMGRKSPVEAMGNVAGNAVNAFNMFSESPDIWQLASPTLLNPLVQIATNKRFSGDPVVHKNQFNQNDPLHTIYRKNTPWIYVKSAEVLNTLSGGDAVVAGKLDVAPEQLKLLTSAIFGGRVDWLVDSVGLIQDDLAGIETTVNQIPFARKVVSDSDADHRVGRYHTDFRAWQEKMDQMGKYKKIGESNKAKAIQESSPTFNPKTISRLQAIHHTLKNVDTSLRRVGDPQLTDQVNAVLSPLRNEAIRLMDGQTDVAQTTDWRKIDATVKRLANIENNLRMVKPKSSTSERLKKTRRETLDALVKLVE